MFSTFMRRLNPGPQETVLDIGVTGDQLYSVSNYFEALFPYKANITAAGLDDASHLETLYPGLKFVQANALDLPFDEGEFDLVHSSAVLEHVGSFENQTKMVAECLRVARRAIFLTTPNRWFPVEFHTQLPLLHWLPPATFRGLLRRFGYNFFADERNLNLMSGRQLQRASAGIPGWNREIATAKLLGWDSNLILIATKSAKSPRK
jgi:ubiquinone/menaquinone biosynthesis C-methylase UbiE